MDLSFNLLTTVKITDLFWLGNRHISKERNFITKTITLGARGSFARRDNGSTRGCQVVKGPPRVVPLSLYEHGRTSGTQGTEQFE